ncbi:MAG: DUF1993 domain-containing protein [Bauldia sp.]
MSLSLYQASIPVFLRQLNGLSTVLDRAIAYCAERKIDQKALLNDRIFPDMFPLTRQVTIASGYAERCGARLTGAEPPKREDAAESLEELKKRVADAIDYVKSIDAKKMEGAEDREISFPVGPNQRTMTGVDYLQHFSMPNFYFHVTTAYNILRHNGVPLGKADFMGAR